MRRREFIALLGSSAVWPAAASAQTPAWRPLIAFLSAVSQERNARVLGAFARGLGELGFADGRNIEIAYRFAEGHLDRLSELAREIVELKPNVVLATVTPGVVAVRKWTGVIPIVCPLLGDPVSLGLIASMARPGGNVTGVAFRTEGLVGKQLELALQLIPAATQIGFLVNVASSVVLDRDEINSLAHKVGVRLVPAEVRGPQDLEAAFHTLAGAGVQAVVVQVDGLFFNERQRVADLAAKARLPAVYGFRDHVDAGGLVSYGVNLAECFHRSATYVVKIVKGAKAADLPVEFPTTLELVLNNGAAKALGLAIPPTLLAVADEVIE
jgi:putative tryptophan/tyrosine transport system substrate-binding protein